MDETRTPFINPELEAIIAVYMDEIDRGQAEDRGVLLQRHPSFEQELRDFFADLDRVSDTARKSSATGGMDETGADQTYIGKVDASSGEDKDGQQGTLIAGRYTLLDNIGEGGMGAVWLAEQHQPVKRKVALKLVKSGLNSREVLTRFEAERQALALMDHPHIAKIFDGGMTEEGRPYFVMEFVKGMIFTEYCDWAKLPLTDRLRLFILVCQAVQHAHQKGIIHRDLKPSNILVSLSDGKPVPKIIDFGLAKTLHKKRTGTALDKHYSGMVGTPLYMSPEQAAYNNDDIDTRTDIYSLGVVLYEMLTGTTPLERQQLQKAKFEDVQRLIQEVDPPRPSMRLSGSTSLPMVAAQRCIDPKVLRRTLARDLDWIVMKALQKDRSLRYETSSHLARDIERFLNDDAVEACPPSTIYRLRKFVKKHRFKVASAAALLLTLVIGIVGTTWGYVQSKTSERKATASEKKAVQALVLAERERDAKEAQRLIAQKAEDAMLASYLESTDDVITNLIGSKDDLGPQERDYLDKTLQRWQAFADRQGDDERSLKYRAEGQYQVGVLWRKLGRYPDARTKLEQALSIQESLVKRFPEAAEYQHEFARIMIGMGVLLHEMGEKSEARAKYEAAQNTLRPLVGASPTDAAYQLDLARATGNLGFLLNDLGEWAASRAQYESARDVLRTLVQQYPAVPEYQGKLVKLHHGLADILIQMGELDGAREEYVAAREIEQQLVKGYPMVPDYQFDLSVSLYGLGDLLSQQGQPEKARVEYEAAREVQRQLVEQFPAVPQYQRGLARSRFAMGNLLSGMGQQVAALQQYEAALSIQRPLVQRFPTVPIYRDHMGDSHFGRGEVDRRLGERDAAGTEYEAALACFQTLTKQFPNEREYRVKHAAALLGLGGICLERGKVVEAQARFVEARDLFLTLVDQFPKVPHYQRCLARSRYSLGGALRELGHFSDARVEYEAGRDLQVQLAQEFPNASLYQANLADSHFGLSDLFLQQKDIEHAKVESRAGQEILRTLVEKYPEVVEYRVTLGGAKSGQGRMILNGGAAAESVLSFIQAIHLLKQIHDLDPQDARAQTLLRNSYWGRAQAYLVDGQLDESLADWDQAIALSPEADRPGLRLTRASTRLRSQQIDAAVQEAGELIANESPPVVWTAEQWYSLARIFAVACDESADHREEYATRAMKLLKQAISAGLNTAEVADRMAAETDLDSLRDRADFAELIESLPKP